MLADSLEQQEEPAGSCGREERPERTATEQQHHDREGAGAAEAAEDVNGPNSSVLKEACLEAAPGPGLEAQGTASTAAALGALLSEQPKMSRGAYGKCSSTACIRILAT